MSNSERRLTAVRVREVLDYDPVTGGFERRIRPTRGLTKEGDPSSPTTGGYMVIAVDGKNYYAHMLAWAHATGEWPERPLVHLNGKKTDNRIDNLAFRVAIGKGGGEELTQERLRQVLVYHDDSGNFIWKVGTARGRPGERAGTAGGPRGHRYISIDGRRYLEHRLVWFYVYGVWPTNQIDHINGNPDDNRLCNIRAATAAQNAQNAVRRPGASGYRGVRRKGNRFLAEIMANNVRIPLGRFDTAEEAHRVYCEAIQKYHGDYAHKDDPPE